MSLFNLPSFRLCVPPEPGKARSESQTDSHTPSWNQSHRPPPGNGPDPGGPPPAKRLKPSPDTQHQLAQSAPASNTLRPAPPRPSPMPTVSPVFFPNTSGPGRPQAAPSAPLPHLQARIGGSGLGTRWSLRQALGRRSLARSIRGKERLAIHLRQRILSDRGEESELLTYQDSPEDLQVGTNKLFTSLLCYTLHAFEPFICVNEC